MTLTVLQQKAALAIDVAGVLAGAAGARLVPERPFASIAVTAERL